MTEHTKEPWRFDGHHSGMRGAGRLIMECIDEHDDIDARRIVACVNACAGISNEELELKNVKPVKAAADYIASIEQQLAEIGKALVESNNAFEAQANRLQESKRQNRELVDALFRYGEHLDICRLFFSDLPCDCGFEQAICAAGVK